MTGIVSKGTTFEQRLSAELAALRQEAELLRRSADKTTERLAQAKVSLEDIRRTTAARMAAGAALPELRTLKTREADGALEVEALAAQLRATDESAEANQSKIHDTLHQLERFRSSLSELRLIRSHHRSRVVMAGKAVEQGEQALDSLRQGLAREQARLAEVERQIAEAEAG